MSMLPSSGKFKWKYHINYVLVFLCRITLAESFYIFSTLPIKTGSMTWELTVPT